MITVINKANKGLYNQLFDDVQKWLYTHNVNGEEIEQYGEGALLGKTTEIVDGESVEVPETLTSLEELFEYMYFITNFAPIYTRLPLDEEPFFIDADKRTISVPKDFASNGVSVQGDEVAEILFFKINRFFDATDLSQCKIFIQWKTNDEDGNPKEGVSKPWIQDIVSEPGYLIFGWPISSAITKTAGNVTFSIRFYRLENETSGKLTYSFSTLDQTVKVQPALDFDIESIANDASSMLIDDMSAEIMLRAINSPTTSSDVVAMKPYWEPWVLDELVSDVQVKKADNTVLYNVMNLGVDSEGFSTLPLKKYTAALSNDSGTVSYYWTKNNKNGTGVITQADGVTKFFAPVLYRVVDTLDSERIENKIYYTFEEDRYKAIAPSTTFESLRELNKEIYELVSEATIDEVGKYIACARNRVGKVFSETLVSDAIYVPMPVAPELGELAASASTGPILDENEVTLSLEVGLFDEFDNDVSETGGKATYVWRRRPLGPGNPEVLENDTEAELILVPDDEENLEGYYSVIVSNNLNNEHVETESNEIRITKPAAKLSLTIEGDDDIGLAAAIANKLPVIVDGVEENRVAGEDSITYQWYKYFNAGQNVEADKALAAAGNYEVNGDLKIEDLTGLGDRLTPACIESSTTSELIPPVSGVYFCKVTNFYNGTESSTISPFYTVVD